MSESYEAESATGVLEAVEADIQASVPTQTGNLEQVLAEIEAQAGDLVKTTKQVMASFKKIKDAAKVGDLVKLRKLLEEGKSATLSLGCDFVKTQERLNFDEASYLAGKDFRQELLTTAQQMGVNLYEHDGYLFSYPVLLKILHKERAVSIDRIRESRLRPSVLVKRLKEVQNKPLRFKPQTFLEMLYTAYSIVVAGRGKHLIGKGTVIPLLELYQLLTLLPWQASEYTRQEFGRDVYLLDKMGTITTKNDHRANFHASTGVRDVSRTLTVIAQGGREKTYYGVSFVKRG
ncbi:MAG: hypothetical protein QNK38_06320 [Nitrospirota bacterium]|nr:hypothetical protein [Nitrospirota bacterium]MDX2420712.1 hypothetical protein [Nitrospirota bacterium]